MITVCNKVIEYSFYVLFFLVPLVFSGNTSELFELNKMWLTWGLTIIIGASWFIKMVLSREFKIQRTPLDIPILLFLASQLLSTIFSLDRHISFWGYYSRFNGGLLSTITYIFLYYAFVSNYSFESANENSFVTFIKKHTNISPSIIKIILFILGTIFFLIAYYLFANYIFVYQALASYKLGLNPPQNFLRLFPLILCIFLAMLSFIWTTSGNMVKRSLLISVISGTIVALWGLPSHFGYDPTCFIFRGTLDVSCWTADFMPRVRIFSTLGQPAWLAAYLAILIPITIAFFINATRDKEHGTRAKLLVACFLSLVSLFYIDLLFTSTRAGVLGIWLSLIFLFLAYVWIRRKNIKSIINLPFSILLGTFLIVTFIIGTPIAQLNSFTLPRLKAHFEKTKITEIPPKTISKDKSGAAQGQTPEAPKQQIVSEGTGGTESGNIRRFVWKGGIDAWKNNPIFGTGVETFAFAYYKYKPVGQNSVSEWNFLYNKAHNEYVNYLATTGTFGLGSYLLMIGWFLWLAIKKLKSQNSKVKTITQNSNLQKEKFLALNFNFELCTLSFALISGYISILISNFFGFSVVIINLYLFLIPAFVFILNGMIKNKTINTNTAKINYTTTIWQWTPIFFISTVSLFMLIILFNYWRADISYARGYNLNRVGEYREAYIDLHKAVELRGDEPVFKDELAINNAILAMSLLNDPANKDDKEVLYTATVLAKEAVTMNDQIIFGNPNNIVFWKSRVRLFFTLSQADGTYLLQALTAIQKAADLAPNDANILYNLGVLYGQNNKIAKGIEALEKTIALKPDYTDAHYALGLFYRSLSMDDAQKVVIDKSLNEKAISQMQYILANISPDYSLAKDAIKDWKKQ